jgi:hypothetical protein
MNTKGISEPSVRLRYANRVCLTRAAGGITPSFSPDEPKASMLARPERVVPCDACVATRRSHDARRLVLWEQLLAEMHGLAPFLLSSRT